MEVRTIRPIIIKTQQYYRNKHEKKEDERVRRLMDASPVNLLLYLCGLYGMIFSVGHSANISINYYLLLIPLLFIINLVLWYLYFYHSKLFLYLSAGLTAICCIIAVPQLFQLTNDIKMMFVYGMPLSEISVSASLMISMLFLFSFLFFALEFVIRSHSLMMAIGLGILILIPVLGYELPLIPMLMLVIYEIGFLVLNMTEKRSLRRSMKTPRRSRINTLSALLTIAILLISFVPAFLIEQNYEPELFSMVYQADGFLKDTVNRFSNINSNGVAGGLVSRGNLYQTGEDKIVITASSHPEETMYLINFRGEFYYDSEWRPAFSFYETNSASDQNASVFCYREHFMNDLLNSMAASSLEEPSSFTYLTVGSSDIISEMYYLLAQGTVSHTELETVEIDGVEYYQAPSDGSVHNPDSSRIIIRHLDEDYYSNNLYVPYFAQKSEARIGFEGDFTDRETGEWGYKNETITPDLINMSRDPRARQDNSDLFVPDDETDTAGSSLELTNWDLNPFYDEFSDKYIDCINQAYRSYPANTLTRLEELCKATPLTDLNDITTYILVTLQNQAVYSTNPGTTPFNKDTIDYFLFDNGMGYCVHFASAATLMYRMYGIPARYVSGYVAEPDLFEARTNADGETVYTATLSDHYAHAWTEIFLKDYGWVPVEVTPSADGHMVASYPGYDNAVMTRIMDQHHWSFRRSSSGFSGQTFTETREEDHHNLWILFLVLAGVLIGASAFIAIRYIRFRRSIAALSCQQLFDLILRNLHQRKVFRHCTGSEKDFALLLKQEFDCLSEEDIQRMIGILQTANFAPEPPPPEDRDFLELCYRRIAQDIDRHSFFLKRPFNRFFLLLYPGGSAP